MILGYARVSASSQSLDIQMEELQKAGCDRIFAEKVSGTSTEGRDQLKGLLTMLRPGDQVVVLRLDRLARSVRDFLDIAKSIEDSGATLQCLLQPIETRTPAGRMFVHMLAAFSAFETEIRKERQAAGIAKAQAARKYKNNGRGPAYDRAVIRHMSDRGMKPSQIAKHFGGSCTEWTVRRALKEIAAKMEKEQSNEARTQI